MDLKACSPYTSRACLLPLGLTVIIAVRHEVISQADLVTQGQANGDKVSPSKVELRKATD